MQNAYTSVIELSPDRIVMPVIFRLVLLNFLAVEVILQAICHPTSDLGILLSGREREDKSLVNNSALGWIHSISILRKVCIKT